jgi:predicted dehydrogenase
MSPTPVKVGIVGLGRWAKVLTRAASQSDRIRIVAGYSRSEEKRAAFHRELGVPPVGDLKDMLADPELKGIILTVPNEQHYPLAEPVASGSRRWNSCTVSP